MTQRALRVSVLRNANKLKGAVWGLRSFPENMNASGNRPGGRNGPSVPGGQFVDRTQRTVYNLQRLQRGLSCHRNCEDNRSREQHDIV